MAGIGTDTYKGLAVPLRGQSNIIQETTVDILTLTLSSESTNPGSFLVGRDLPSSVTTLAGKNEYTDPTVSTLTTADVINIDSLGGYRSQSGNSTILMEMNTSGIFGREGTTREWQIDSTGYFRGLKRLISSASSGVTTDQAPTSTDSGTLFIVGTSNSQSFSLPAAPVVGTYYDIVVSTQADTTDFIITTTLNGNSRITMAGLTDAGVSTGLYVRPHTTLGYHSIRLTAILTTLWFAEYSLGTRTTRTTATLSTDYVNTWGLSSEAAA